MLRIATINITGGGISGGYKKYLINMIPRIAGHPEVEAVLCASPEGWNQESWFKPLSHVEFINCRPFRLLQLGADKELQERLSLFKPNVIYVPIERNFCYNKISVVNMIQNMEPMVKSLKGNPFLEKMKLSLQYLISKNAIKKADRIIAVSQFVKDYVVKQWHSAPDKVGLVYHGLQLTDYDDSARPATLPPSWGNKFLFTAGSVRPARGLEDSFYALKYLLAHKEDAVKGLVIAGECTPNMVTYKKRWQKWLKAENLTDKVHWAGVLPEAELNWCYRNCLMFIMTSRVESFGLIGLEAMAQGSVCLAATNPCLPEIFADAAVYYRPGDGYDLAHKIQEILQWDVGKRQEYFVRAKNRAAEFSWDKAAAALIEELKIATNKTGTKLK